jgi:peptidoglycan hydrolase CwlO-like protein
MNKKILITSVLALVFFSVATIALASFVPHLNNQAAPLQSVTLQLNLNGAVEQVTQTVTPVSLSNLQAQSQALTGQIASLQAQLDTVNSEIKDVQNVASSGQPIDITSLANPNLTESQ